MFASILNLLGQSDAGGLAHAIEQGAFLVDVRTPAEFAQGHPAGSVNIPLDQLPRKLASFQGKEHIIVFCRSGNRSAQAKAILERQGYKNVINGGTWQAVDQALRKRKN